MSEINALLEQQSTMLAYIELRNAPRDTIVRALIPDAKKCLAEYDRLQVALAGGDAERGIPNISALAADFATVTGPVTPFVNLLRFAMRIIIDTPRIVDQAATAQGMIIAPFGVDISQPLDPAGYAQMLGEAAAAIMATGQALQAMAQQGGNE